MNLQTASIQKKRILIMQIRILNLYQTLINWNKPEIIKQSVTFTTLGLITQLVFAT